MHSPHVDSFRLARESSQLAKSAGGMEGKAFQYVALCSMVVMALSAGVSLLRQLDRHPYYQEGKGR